MLKRTSTNGESILEVITRSTGTIYVGDIELVLADIEVGGGLLVIDFEKLALFLSNTPETPVVPKHSQIEKYVYFRK